MKIIIETIPHRKQRQPGNIGDWCLDPEGNIQILVSELGDWRMEAAVAVHELVEALLCRNDDVSQEQVDHFDTGFRGEGEPGDAHDAPYARQHCFATSVERMLIAALGLSWADYDRRVEALL
jgi:hypothetical protein